MGRTYTGRITDNTPVHWDRQREQTKKREGYADQEKYL